jgi:hypothetical protein
MERMELSNPREVIKKLLQESKATPRGANELDPLAYFEQHVDWDEVNPLLGFRLSLRLSFGKPSVDV